MDQIKHLGVCIFLSTALVSWTIIGSNLGVSAAWMGTIVMGATTFAVVILAYSANSFGDIPTYPAVLLLIFLGFLDGIAVYIYSGKLTDPNINTSSLVVSISILMVIEVPILTWIFKGIVPNGYQISGLVLAIPAIYLLNR